MSIRRFFDPRALIRNTLTVALAALFVLPMSMSASARSAARGVGEAVTLYEHANFRGQSRSFAEGSYRMGRLGIPNDSLSSLRVPAGLEVELYEHEGFRGRKKVVRGDVHFLHTFNDEVSSIRVRRTAVTLFKHRDFRGARQWLKPGRYDIQSLKRRIGNDRLSSLKIPRGWKVTLYEHAGFRGRMTIVEGNARNLRHFDNTTSSIVVSKTRAPKKVTAFEHNDFKGRRIHLALGRYTISDLRGVGNDMISSLRVPAGWEVVLFEHANFRGRTRLLTRNTRALFGFNDVVSSIVVRKAPRGVTIFEHNDFKGRRQVLEAGSHGMYRLAHVGNDTISSLRIPRGWTVTLFEHAGFRGRTVTLTSDTRALPRFNDKTSSIIIRKNGFTS